MVSSLNMVGFAIIISTILILAIIISFIIIFFLIGFTIKKKFIS